MLKMKKQGSERAHIISLLKKSFGKHFKVFHKFVDTGNEFFKLFSLQLINICIYFYINMYVYIGCKLDLLGYR